MRSGCVMRTSPPAFGTTFVVRFAAGAGFFAVAARFRAGPAAVDFAIEVLRDPRDDL
jgi:hypothetical protein